MVTKQDINEAMNKWNEIGGGNSQVFTFDEDDNSELEGLLVRKQENVGPNNSMMYTIENKKDHEQYGVWGSTALDDKMALVNVGDEVKIVYEGIQTSEKTNRQYKSFRVYSRQVMKEV